MLLAGSSCAVFAQNDSLHLYNTGSWNHSDSISRLNNMEVNNAWSGNSSQLSSNGSYNAYNAYLATAPYYVQGYVLRDYPMATNLHWQQNNDWWHAYYLNGTQPMHVYYNNAGQTFNVSLPVKQSFIPDDVSSRAIQNWGPEVYDIISLKGTQGQDIYQVRIIENGVVSSQYMDANGNKVIDIYREDPKDVPGIMPVNNSSQPVSGSSSDADMNHMGTETATGSDMSTSDQDMGKLKIKTKTSDGKKTKTKIVNGKVKSKTDE